MNSLQGPSRRAMLRNSAVGFGHLALCGMLSRAAAEDRVADSGPLRFWLPDSPTFRLAHAVSFFCS